MQRHSLSAAAKRRRVLLKVILYLVMVFLALVAQTLLPLAPRWQVRPALLIALSGLVAFFEGPQFGGAFGVLCGILCDWLSVHTVSYYTVVLMLFGVLLGLLVEHSMRRNLLSGMFVSIILLVLVQGIYCLLFLWMPGRAGGYPLIEVVTPEILYTLLLTPLFYLPCMLISKRLEL